MTYRIEQDGPMLSGFAHRGKELCQIFAYESKEQGWRSSQIEYFLEKSNPRSVARRVDLVLKNAKQIQEDLDVYKRTYNIHALYILSHGDKGSGHICLEDDTTLSYGELRAMLQRTPGGLTFSYMLQCLSYMDRTLPPADPRILRVFGLNVHVGTSSRKPYHVTYNTPRELVDGKPGWVHTGLNPEVLMLETVQKYHGI